MSIFSTIINKKAEEAISTNPAVQTGWLVSTAAVIEKDLANPFMLSMSSMSGLDAEKLKRDAVTFGASVAVKDLSTGRKEKVYVNPKPADMKLFGNDTGKLGNLQFDGKDVRNVDMVFSGTNNQLPTVIGVQIIKGGAVQDSTTVSTNDAQATTPAGESSNMQKPPLIPTQGAGLGWWVPTLMDIVQDVTKGKPIPQSTPPINPSQKPKDLTGIVQEMVQQSQTSSNKPKAQPTPPPDPTQRGPYGNIIRTGTTKVPKSDLEYSTRRYY